MASGYTIGMRFHSAPVIRLGDAKPMQLGHAMKADGRWRLMAFAAADDVGATGGVVDGLCEFLAHGADSPVVRFTGPDADIDSVLDLRAVFQACHRDLDLGQLPGLLLPRKGKYGLIDYEKVFCPDLKNGPDIFDLRGIDRTTGALLIVRPDQYVAQVLPLDAFEDMAGFFNGFMVPSA